MNKSERLAQTYLQSLNIGAVVFEPDGNVPPDFSIGDTVAVEVRRLNQNFQAEGRKARGLEEEEIPLAQRIHRRLREFAPSADGESWYVGFGFRRPLESWHLIGPLLNGALHSFMSQTERSPKKLQLTPHFDIDFFPADQDAGSFFVLGAYDDGDSGGWIMYELEKNLRLCISEKERKIESFRSKYAEWWLVLEDRIDHALESKDRERFRVEVMPKIEHSFDRLVLLDPRGERSPFEV